MSDLLSHFVDVDKKAVKADTDARKAYDQSLIKADILALANKLWPQGWTAVDRSDNTTMVPENGVEMAAQIDQTGIPIFYADEKAETLFADYDTYTAYVAINVRAGYDVMKEHPEAGIFDRDNYSGEELMRKWALVPQRILKLYEDHFGFCQTYVKHETTLRQHMVHIITDRLFGTLMGATPSLKHLQEAMEHVKEFSVHYIAASGTVLTVTQLVEREIMQVMMDEMMAGQSDDEGTPTPPSATDTRTLN